MAICELCGEEFDISSVRRSIGQSYGAGTYRDYYGNREICLECATEEISADWAAGAEIIELMGTGWDDD